VRKLKVRICDNLQKKHLKVV